MASRYGPCLLGTGSDAQAQVNTYSFLQSQGTYTPIATPDETPSTQGINEDDNSYSVDIGFSFNFNGNFYSQMGVNNNGVIWFDSQHPFNLSAYSGLGSANPSGSGMLFENTVNIREAIGAFVCDLHAQDGTPIKVFRSGASPSRIIIIEWSNQRRYHVSSSAGEAINFQIILHESTNSIDIVYGAMTYGDNVDEEISVGLLGDDLTDFNSRTGTTIANTSLASAAGDQVTPFPQVPVAAGTTFTYTPIPPAPNDLGIIAILAPRPDQTTCLPTAPQPVRVVVRNFGSATQTSAPFTYTVNNGTPVSQTFTFGPAPLVQGATDTLTFTTGVNMSTAGPYTFTATVSLPTELPANQVNNTLGGYSITLTGPVAAPTTPIGTLDSLTQVNSWIKAHGRNLILAGSTEWTTGFPYNSSTIALLTPHTSEAHKDQQEWLISPNYNVNATSYLIFSAFVDSGSGGNIVNGNNIGDDTLRVAYSSDCGTTWHTLTRFDQRDIASGRFTNQPQEFRVPLTTVGASVRVGFFVTNNNTNDAHHHRFQLDNIQVKDLPPNDLGVTAVLRPLAGTPGCVLTTQEDVTVVVKNYGTATQTSAPVKYKLYNGTTPGPEVTQTFTFTYRGTVPNPLPPGQTDTVTFSGATGADLSVAGTYHVFAYTSLNGETVQSNLNDSTNSANVIVSNPLPLPAPVIGSYTNLFTAQWGKGRGLGQPSGNASDWLIGTIPGNPTANGVIAIKMDTTRNHVQREWIYSPSYQSSSATFLIFKASVVATGNADPAPFGMGDDTLSVLVSSDCGGNWTRIARFSNSDVLAGRLTSTLTEFSYRIGTGPGRLQVAFMMNNNTTPSVKPGYRLFLDDISILDAPSNDAGVTAGVAPVASLYGCAPGSVHPSATVRNYGADPLTSVTLCYTLDTQAEVCEQITFSPALQPGDARTVTFAATAVLDPGTHTIQFRTNLTGDANAANDTNRHATVTYNNPVSAVTGYQQDFESVAQNVLPPGWSAGARFNDFNTRTIPGLSPNNVLRARFTNALASSFATTPQLILSTDVTFDTAVFSLRIIEPARGTATILGSQDTIHVDVTTDCGANWVQKLTITSANQVPSPDLVPFKLDLTGYAGQTVMLRFAAHIVRQDAAGAYVEVDNVNISTIVANKPLVAGRVALYPNPSKGLVTLERFASGSATAVVIDGLGRTVATQSLSAISEQLDLSALPRGIYSVLVKEAAGTSRQRLVLE